MKYLLGFVTVILLVSYAQLVKEPASKSKKISVADAFKKANITTCVIPDIPSKLLGVKYENAVVNLGNEIYPGDTIEPPTYEFKVERNVFYAIAFVDLDVPSKEDNFLSPVLLQLVVNILNLDLDSACEIAQYVPVTPVPGTGLHRYVIILFEQERVIDSSNPDVTRFQEERIRFPLLEFAKNNSLCTVAGNYFVSQFPDDLKSYCDEISC